MEGSALGWVGATPKCFCPSGLLGTLARSQVPELVEEPGGAKCCSSPPPFSEIGG